MSFILAFFCWSRTYDDIFLAVWNEKVMDYVIFGYKWWNRELRRVISVLLKAWVAKEIQKINYVQRFSLREKNLEKSEMKLLFILTDNLEKLLDFVPKNFPEMDRIKVS